MYNQKLGNFWQFFGYNYRTIKPNKKLKSFLEISLEFHKLWYINKGTN